MVLDGFESFSVSCWYDNVLTKHVKVVKAVVKNTAEKWVGAVVATSLVVACAAPVGAFGQPAPIVQPAPSRHTLSDSKYGDLVSPGYWPKLMNDMKTWEKVPEVDFADED